MAIAPLLPEGVELGGLLVSLLVICAALVALGMVTIMQALTNSVIGGIAGVVGDIPLIGKWLASPVNEVQQWMTHLFASAERDLDGIIARALHDMATLWHWMGVEIRETSSLVHTLATFLLGSTAIRALENTVHTVTRRIDTIENTADNALNRALHFEATLPARVEGIVLPRLRTIEHELDWTIPRDIAGLRAGARSLTDRLEALFQRTKKLDALLGTAALTGAVAIALSRLDLGWIRCRNVGRVGKQICGINSSLLDDLLGLIVDFFILENVCALIPLLETAASEIGTPLVEALTAVGAGLCAGNEAPAKLTGPATQLVPVTFDGTLTLAA